MDDREKLRVVPNPRRISTHKEMLDNLINAPAEEYVMRKEILETYAIHLESAISIMFSALKVAAEGSLTKETAKLIIKEVQDKLL